MPSYYFQDGRGGIATINADRIEDDEETGVRRFVRGGEVVHSLPAGTRVRVIEVTEVIRPSGNDLPMRPVR